MSAELAAAWHLDQRHRVTTRRPLLVDLPGSYRCVGACTIPPPPAPGAEIEMFAAVAEPATAYWAVLAAASLTFAALTLWGL